MARAKNEVIAGDYLGYSVNSGLFTPSLIKPRAVPDYVTLDTSTVSGVELITDEHRKSAASGVARGLVGGALLGPVGMMAGGLSAKSKGIYTVAIQFKDGKSSLIEVNDKLYKSIMKSCFLSSNPQNNQIVTPIGTKSKNGNTQQPSNMSIELNNHNTRIVQNIIFVIDNYFDEILDIETVCDKMDEYTESIDEINDAKCHYELSLKAFPISTEFLKLSSDSMKNDADTDKIWQLRNELAEMIETSPRQQTEQPSTSIANKFSTKKSYNSPAKTEKALSDGVTDRDIAQKVVEAIDAYFDEKTDLETTDQKITQYYLAIADMSLADNVKHELFMEICDISIGLSSMVLGEELDINIIKDHRNALAKLIGLPEINIISKSTSTPANSSAADEIRKFKVLLDDGIITEEEFAAKKKQLLGL